MNNELLEEFLEKLDELINIMQENEEKFFVSLEFAEQLKESLEDIENLEDFE